MERIEENIACCFPSLPAPAQVKCGPYVPTGGPDAVSVWEPRRARPGGPYLAMVIGQGIAVNVDGAPFAGTVGSPFMLRHFDDIAVAQPKILRLWFAAAFERLQIQCQFHGTLAQRGVGPAAD